MHKNAQTYTVRQKWGKRDIGDERGVASKLLVDVDVMENFTQDGPKDWVGK